MDISNLATKDDLKNEVAKLATKDDLKGFATKDDLKVIKADIRELKASDRAIRADLLRLETRIEKLEEGQKTILAMLIQIQNTLDAFVGRVDNLTIDNEIGTHQIRELDLKIKNHETRLTHLESPTA